MSQVFDTRDAPEGLRTDYWQHAVASSGLPPLRGGHHAETDFRARLFVGDIGALRVAEAATPEGECWRDFRLARQSDCDLCQIEVLSQGTVAVEQNDRQARLRADDIVIVDPSQPVRFTTSATTNVTLLLPRAMLAIKPEDLRRQSAVPIPGDRGTGALISSLARGLPRFLDGHESGETARISAAIVDLLGAALAARLGQPLSARSRESALLQHVYAFMDANLRDRNLSPGSVAAAHHISVRYLHKLFETEPATVTAWIRQRRLQRCHRDLLDVAQHGRSVASIAARWGMSDPASFSRLFKSAYGMPPSDYRATAGTRSHGDSANQALSFKVRARIDNIGWGSTRDY